MSRLYKFGSLRTMPVTRRRLLGIALITILLGFLGVSGFRGVAKARESRAKDSSSPPAATGVPDRREETSRRKGERNPGEAKLKSLLAVREGEVAFIRLSSAQMERLAVGVEELGLGQPPEIPSPVPSMAAILSPGMILKQLAGATEGIDGDVDVSGDDFEWRGPGMELRGTMLREQDTVTLDFTFTGGSSRMECTTTTVPGSVVFLRSGNSDPGGVLLVVGGQVPGTEPAGE